MTERTLVLVKPDGVARGLVGEVITRLERKGLRLVAAELRTLDRDTAETHYAEHSERPFFGSLVEFITGGPLMALVVEGPRAIVLGDTVVDFGRGLELNQWLKGGVTHDEVKRRLRPILDLPIELVLPTHGTPTDRAELERVLA